MSQHIINIFNKKYKNTTDINVARHYLASRGVAKFCDCSTNFEQSKLLAKFDEKFPKDFIINLAKKKSMNNGLILSKDTTQKQRKKCKEKKKNTETNIETLIEAILLNRVLQTVRSPARKSHSQIANHLDCSAGWVAQTEQHIMSLLRKKSAVLKLLVTTKWNE